MHWKKLLIGPAQKIPFLNSAISEKAQNLKKTRLYAAAEKDFLNAAGQALKLYLVVHHRIWKWDKVLQTMSME